MIIPLPFIVSLLFTITYATDFEYKIDLTRCSEDTTCFVRKKCITAKSTEPAAETTLAKFADIAETTKIDLNCDAVIQVKVLDKSKYLVLMQITADTADLDEVKGIAIKHADAEQIVCKKEGENIVHTLTPVPTKNDFFDTVGTKSSVFEATKLFCSLFITTKDEMSVSSHFTIKNSAGVKIFDNYPSLVYTQNNDEKTIEFKAKLDKFWELPYLNARCKPESIKSIEETNDNYVLKEIDLTLPSIKCAEGELMLKKDDGTESFGTQEYICKQEDEVWEWSNSFPSSGTVACVMTRFCSACGDTPPSSPECSPPDTCTAPTIDKDSTTGCQTLTCPSTENEFTFDGKSSAKSDGAIICKKIATDPTKSGWFFKGHEGDTPKEKLKIACATIKDCNHNQFDFTCPEEIKDVCKKPDYDPANLNFTCTEGYLQKGDGKEVATDCDRKTGKWKGLDDNANIFCAPDTQKKADENTDDGETKGAGAGLYIGIIFGVLVIGGAGVFLFWKFVYKKRQDAKKTTKKEEGTSKKSSKKVESKSGAVGSSNEAKKEEKKSDPNKESEKPAAEGAKDGKETPKDGAEPPKETPKDAAATPAAAAATPGAPPTPGAAAPTTPATPAADSAPAPADVTPV